MTLKSPSVSDPVFGWDRFALYKDPSFRFDPEAHLSYIGDRIPWSITGCLRQAGIAKAPYGALPEHRIRGSHVHAACHYLDEGDFDWDHFERIQPNNVGYVRAWKAFTTDWNFKPRMIELPMYADEEHGGIFFSGIADREGLILDGDPAIVEIKTGGMPPSTRYQTAGQELLIRAWETTFIFRRRFGVALQADGTYMKPKEFTRDDEHDHDRFRAALMCAQASGGVDRGVPPLEI